MARSPRDTGVVFPLPDVNEGWRGCANSLGKLFLNPTVRQCPGLLPRLGHSREVSHSRLSWRRSSSVGRVVALTPSLPQFPQLQGGSRNSLPQTQRVVVKAVGANAQLERYQTQDTKLCFAG